MEPMENVWQKSSVWSQTISKPKNTTTQNVKYQRASLKFRGSYYGGRIPYFPTKQSLFL